LIEVLNGYRIKERRPDNIGDYTVPLGQAERMCEGEDLTVVSYGATLWIVMEAAEYLKEHNISIEVLDVQTLMPFDIHGMIRQSVKKTNRVLFVDEDVPGGGTAYMLERALSEQNIFGYLEIPPRTLSSRNHRPAYGDDGNYTTKPNAEDVVMEVLRMLHEVNPEKYAVVI
jgi:pyruvate/2-oxoglutarate/acetoin dehydrogenase E1 component